MIVASSSLQARRNACSPSLRISATFVRQCVQQGTSFDDFERGALGQILQMGSAAAQLFLLAQGNGDLGETVTTENGTILERSDGPLARPLRSIFGEHFFTASSIPRAPTRKSIFGPSTRV